MMQLLNKHTFVLISIIFGSFNFVIGGEPEWRITSQMHHEQVAQAMQSLVNSNETVNIDQCYEYLLNNMMLPEQIGAAAKNPDQLAQFRKQIAATLAACSTNQAYMQVDGKVYKLSDKEIQIIREAHSEFVNKPRTSGKDAFLNALRSVHAKIMQAQALHKSQPSQPAVKPQTQPEPVKPAGKDSSGDGSIKKDQISSDADGNLSDANKVNPGENADESSVNHSNKPNTATKPDHNSSTEVGNSDDANVSKPDSQDGNNAEAANIGSVEVKGSDGHSSHLGQDELGKQPGTSADQQANKNRVSDANSATECPQGTITFVVDNNITCIPKEAYADIVKTEVHNDNVTLEDLGIVQDNDFVYVNGSMFLNFAKENPELVAAGGILSGAVITTAGLALVSPITLLAVLAKIGLITITFGGV